MKKTVMSVMLCVTLLAFAATTLAASDDGIVLSKDGRLTISTKPMVRNGQYFGDNASLTTIYDNLGGFYKDGVYWCCTGETLSGPNSVIGEELWAAVGFTATTSSVNRISVAVGYVSGTFTDILLSLREDSNGIPGKTLQSWKVTGLPTFGTCCTVDTKNSTAGVAVTKGSQYWIVVSTESKSDIWAAWNLNDTKQLSTDAIPEAFYCNGSKCGSNNGKWVSAMGYPGFAFGVWGK